MRQKTALFIVLLMNGQTGEWTGALIDEFVDKLVHGSTDGERMMGQTMDMRQNLRYNWY